MCDADRLGLRYFYAACQLEEKHSRFDQYSVYNAWFFGVYGAAFDVVRHYDYGHFADVLFVPVGYRNRCPLCLISLRLL